MCIHSYLKADGLACMLCLGFSLDRKDMGQTQYQVCEARSFMVYIRQPIMSINICQILVGTLEIYIAIKCLLIYTFNTHECQWKALQLHAAYTKQHFYSKSHENQYQYYKSRTLRLNIQRNPRFV